MKEGELLKEANHYKSKTNPFGWYQSSILYFLAGSIDEAIERAKREIETSTGSFKTKYELQLKALQELKETREKKTHRAGIFSKKTSQYDMIRELLIENEVADKIAKAGKKLENADAMPEREKRAYGEELKKLLVEKKKVPEAIADYVFDQYTFLIPAILVARKVKEYPKRTP